jgi:hypothetical protein
MDRCFCPHSAPEAALEKPLQTGKSTVQEPRYGYTST